MTINESIKLLLDDKLIFTKSETYRFYLSHCNILEKYFNNIELKNITNDIVKNFILFQKKNNLTNNTINKRLQILKQLLNYDHLILDIPKLKLIEKNFDFLSFLQVKKLLNYISTSNIKLQNKLIFRILLDSGIRLNELINIKIDNIDLSHNCILLETTKTDKERFIFFTDDTKENYLLPYLLNDCSCNSIYLFNITRSGVESLFDRVNKKLKFKKFRPHMLRHTYATILINKNTNLFFIQKTLGHSSLQITKKYLHTTQEQLFKTYKEQFNYNE